MARCDAKNSMIWTGGYVNSSVAPNEYFWEESEPIEYNMLLPDLEMADRDCLGTSCDNFLLTSFIMLNHLII